MRAWVIQAAFRIASARDRVDYAAGKGKAAA
jgi:hypothetical protein